MKIKGLVVLLFVFLLAFQFVNALRVTKHSISRKHKQPVKGLVPHLTEESSFEESSVLYASRMNRVAKASAGNTEEGEMEDSVTSPENAEAAESAMNEENAAENENAGENDNEEAGEASAE